MGRLLICVCSGKGWVYPVDFFPRLLFLSIRGTHAALSVCVRACACVKCWMGGRKHMKSLCKDHFFKKYFAVIHALEHVWTFASVCLNMSRVCMCVCAHACMPVHVNRCTGWQPVAPFCSLSVASNQAAAQYSMSKPQLIPDLLSEQLPRVLWGRMASWTSSCPLTYSMGGGQERLFFWLFVSVCWRSEQKRGGPMTMDWWEQRRLGGVDVRSYGNTVTDYITEWTKTSLAAEDGGGGGETGIPHGIMIITVRHHRGKMQIQKHHHIYWWYVSRQYAAMDASLRSGPV